MVGESLRDQGGVRRDFERNQDQGQGDGLSALHLSRFLCSGRTNAQCHSRRASLVVKFGSRWRKKFSPECGRVSLAAPQSPVGDPGHPVRIQEGSAADGSARSVQGRQPRRPSTCAERWSQGSHRAAGLGTRRGHVPVTESRCTCVPALRIRCRRTGAPNAQLAGPNGLCTGCASVTPGAL